MQKFHFKAVTQDGKQLTGYIDAESEDIAHDKLVDAKMAVLDMELFDETKHGKVLDDSLLDFEYQARNEVDHKLFKGKIQAHSDYDAYKKLRVEYHLEVDYIVPFDLPEEQKASLRMQGVSSEYETKVQTEINRINEKKKKKANKTKGISDEDTLDRALDERSDSLQFYQERIDEMLMEIMPLIKKNERFLKRDKKKEIEDKLNLLARLKRSNSLDHLKSLVDKALDGISDEKIFLEELELDKLSPEDRASIQEMQGASEKIKLGIEKALMDAQLQLGGFSPDEIKEKFQDLNLPQKVFRFFYLVHFNLLIFILLFWIGYAVIWKMLVSQNFTEGKAYFFSENLFLFFGVALFFVVLFWKEFFGKKTLTIKALGIKSAIHVVFVLIFVLFFPSLFFWIY